MEGLVRRLAIARYDEAAEAEGGRLSNLDGVRRKTFDDALDAVLGPVMEAARVVVAECGDDASEDDMVRGLKARLGESPLAEIAWSAANHGVDAEDKYRRNKGNEIVRPSSQLNLDGIPSWLEEDAFVPTQDGGRYRAADGKLEDWGPTILEPMDRKVEELSIKRAEKYATFREMASGLAKGLSNKAAWLAARK
jgi:hypothetical protein